MILDRNVFFAKVKFLSYIICRSFFIAVICLLVSIFLFVSIYFGDYFVNVNTGNYKSSIVGGYIIVSKSMVPTINVNDAILIKRNNNNNYDLGDIITFFSTEYNKNGFLVTHRIINKIEKSNQKYLYTTKGDHNISPDKQLVQSGNIYGKVLFIIPKLGYVQQFLSNPINYVFCIAFPVFVVIVCFFTKTFILFKKNERNNFV